MMPSTTKYPVNKVATPMASQRMADSPGLGRYGWDGSDGVRVVVLGVGDAGRGGGERGWLIL